MTAIPTHAARPNGHAKGHAHHDGEVHAHVAPWQFMLAVLVVLLAMTGLTVYTALFVHLGELGNLILALSIAFFKAALVVGFFMHLHWDNKFNAVALLFCLLAIATFMIFTIIDLGHRGLVDPTQAQMRAPEIARQARERAIAEGRLAPDGGHAGGGAGHEAPPAKH
jgi:cytochrome c oxidase subunit 4